jgi:ABC-type phosphate transport system substrate-binding protein
VIGKEGAAHEEFVKKYLGRSSAALDIYYRSLAFTGKGAMPKSFASDAQVAAYVAKTKGAIGYVSTGTSTPGVKILEIQ